MTINNIIEKLLSIIASKKDAKDERTKVEYEVLSKYINSIKNIKNDSDIVSINQQLVADRENHLKRYNSFRSQHDKLVSAKASIRSKNDIAVRANKEAYSVDALNSIIKIINSYLLGNKFVTKPNQPQVQAQTSTPKSNSPLAVGFKKDFIKNEFTLNYFHYCKLIKDIYIKLSKLSYSSEEALSLRKELYEYVNLRRQFINRLFLDTDEMKDINTHLYYIESRERVIYMEKSAAATETKTCSCSECITSLKDIIKQINEIYFSDGFDKDKLFDLINKYNDIILSANDVSKTPGLDEMSKDLLYLISKFNMDGNYSRFKNHYENGKIGTEAISRDMYLEGVKDIDSVTNSLSKAIEKALSGKPLTITSHSKSFGEKESELYDRHYKICDKILVLSKEKTL